VKKNQVLQLLLVLQLVIVVVLVVSFWDRYRGASVQQSGSLSSIQASTCRTNTCSTCSGGCQLQTSCSTCGGNAVSGAIGISGVSGVASVNTHRPEEIQKAVDSAVDSILASKVEGLVNNVVDGALQSKLDSAVKSAVADSVNNSVNGAVNSAVDTKLNTAVNNAVNSAVNNAVGTAMQDAENRFLSNAEEMVGRSIDEAQLSARAYDPASKQPPLNQAPALEVPADVNSVPDAVKALAAEQNDDFDALASRTSNFKSTENSFETTSDILFEGSALKFQPETSEDVLTVFRGGAVDDDGVFIFKRFGEDHTILAVNSPPSTAPFYGKESTLALVRGDEPNVEVVDFYNQDYPEAGVRQAGIRVIKEVGPDVTKSEWLPFAIDYAAHDTQTKETTEYEVLKVMPPSPQANVQANVQINGYMQIDVVNEPGAPPLEDCNAIEEHGRMKVDPREGVSLLYICTSDGWVAK